MLPSELLHQLSLAKSITCLTGAGVSAESGIPTFRDAQTGLWANYQPQDLASPQGFLQNPKLVWEWYAWRRKTILSCQPNPAHLSLAKIAQIHPLTLITQNVDGLHQRAGSTQVIELHGNLHRLKCFNKNHPVEYPTETNSTPPRCPQCQSFLRPDVVWFGESLPHKQIGLAIQASRTCNLFISAGTSSLVYPAASLPEFALANGATLLEINPQPTPLTPYAHFSLRYPAGQIFPLLLQALQSPPN
jgi:NAD-dependent deacetylase